MSTNRLGFIGEEMVKLDLLDRYPEFQIYRPCVDDHLVDFLVDTGKSIKKVQVKTRTKLKTKSAMEIRLGKYTKSDIDVIAVYYKPKDLICYVPYSGEQCLNLAMTSAMNNQKSKRNWFYQYMEFPV